MELIEGKEMEYTYGREGIVKKPETIEEVNEIALMDARLVNHVVQVMGIVYGGETNWWRIINMIVERKINED